jgi:hypothetical protein
MLEHNQFFWLSFLKITRVLKQGGIMIHIVPSRGPEHRAPQDCWRFYKDGMEALAAWSGLTIIEATTDWSDEDLEWIKLRYPKRHKHYLKTNRFSSSIWGDTVGVFQKIKTTARVLVIDMCLT